MTPIYHVAQSLRDLDTSLRELDSRLIVLRGNPKDELPRILGEWDVQRLAYETDIEPYAKSRDGEINQLAATAGVARRRRTPQNYRRVEPRACV